MIENQKKEKTVAIIGRPNVGKSTFFNRLVGRRIAIEAPIAGTTRDRLMGEVSWGYDKFILIDVAGIEFGSKKELEKSMQEGVQLALETADLVLFMVDWTDPDNETDKIVARHLRQSGKPTLLVVNKADNLKRQENLDRFKRLGFQSPIPVSSISGTGSGDLLDRIVEELQKTPAVSGITEPKPDDQIKLSIVGRPNVGKSTLLNTIIGEKRAVVSSEAGTTRDIISVSFSHLSQKVEIIDTAGIRRPGKIGKDTIESFSLIRTYRAINNCDVAIVLIDAIEGLVALDANILGRAIELGKAVVLAINKIDLVEEDQQEFMAKMIWRLQSQLNFAPWLPIIFVSAQDDQNIKSLLNQAINAYKARNTLIPEDELQSFLEVIKNSNNQLVSLIKFTQKSTNPPVFELKYKNKTPHPTQVRYIENKLRDIYPMSGTPVFIDLISTSRRRRRK